MAKKVDITEKLELDGNPSLVIKGQELEVNADAATMLKIMNKYADFDEREASAKDIMDLYDLVFPKDSQKKIEKMKLSFTDLTVAITAAQALITGEDPNEEMTSGEVQTHTMT